MSLLYIVLTAITVIITTVVTLYAMAFAHYNVAMIAMILGFPIAWILSATADRFAAKGR